MIEPDTPHSDATESHRFRNGSFEKRASKLSSFRTATFGKGTTPNKERSASCARNERAVLDERSVTTGAFVMRVHLMVHNVCTSVLFTTAGSQVLLRQSTRHTTSSSFCVTPRFVSQESGRSEADAIVHIGHTTTTMRYK